MPKDSWFVMRPEKAQAYGLAKNDCFIVLAGSTAMKNGSPNKKRNKQLRDGLVVKGILVQDADIDLYRFAVDHCFTSSSAAGGVIKDGNCSGPQSWRRVGDNKTLKEAST